MVEHGRWTRGVEIETDGQQMKIRMAEVDSILMWSSEQPSDVQFGIETDPAHPAHTAKDFAQWIK